MLSFISLDENMLSIGIATIPQVGTEHAGCVSTALPDSSSRQAGSKSYANTLLMKSDTNGATFVPL